VNLVACEISGNGMVEGHAGHERNLTIKLVAKSGKPLITRATATSDLVVTLVDTRSLGRQLLPPSSVSPTAIMDNKDADNNNVIVRLAKPSNGVPIDAITSPIVPVPGVDGAFTSVHRLPSAGQYQLSVTWQGQPIGKSPYFVRGISR
jgi:hypothetical protein